MRVGDLLHFFPDEFDGDAFHAGVVVALAEAAGVAGDVVAEDVLELAVGTDEVGRGWAVDGDDGFAEGDGDVEWAGVVAEDEGGAVEEGDHLGEGGLAGEIGGGGGGGLDLVAEGFFVGAAEEEDVLAVGEEFAGDFDVAFDIPAFGVPASAGDDGDEGIRNSEC